MDISAGSTPKHSLPHQRPTFSTNNPPFPPTTHLSHPPSYFIPPSNPSSEIKVIDKMDIADYLHPQNVKIHGSFPFKKHLFEALGRACETFTTLDKMTIATRLFERERLGCTYFEDQCALPHISLEPHELINTTKDVHGVVLVLDTPIDYDPPHKKHVNLVFFILAIKGKRACQALELARFRLRSPWVREHLRHARTPEEAYAIISGPIHTNTPASCPIDCDEQLASILPEV